MTADEYLRVLQQKELMITALQEDIDSLRHSLSLHGICYDKNGSGTCGEKVEYILDVIAKKEKELDKIIDEFVDYKAMLQEMINNLPDERKKKALKLCYIQYKTVQQISCEIGFSERTIRRTLEEALKDFENMYNDILRSAV